VVCILASLRAVGRALRGERDSARSQIMGFIFVCGCLIMHTIILQFALKLILLFPGIAIYLHAFVFFFSSRYFSCRIVLEARHLVVAASVFYIVFSLGDKKIRRLQLDLFLALDI
jgi:hypothetical protein